MTQATTTRRRSLVRRPDPDAPAPLSFPQSGMWFGDRSAAGPATLNDPQALRLSGPLDTDALRRAFAGVAARHEVLRVRYGLDRGVPVQTLHPGWSPDFEVLDATGLDDAACAARVLAEASGDLDLSAGVALRVRLFRRAQDEHVLLILFHHIVTDAGSLSIFLRDLGALYRRGRGLAADLPELPVQYPDFACWQRDRLRGPTLDRLLAHWRAELDGAPHRLALPLDRPRPAQRSGPGRQHTLRLPSALADRLTARARAEGASPFMLGLAAFRALLFRHTGQRDILIGTPLTARLAAGTEHLVGCFLNMLVLRGRLTEAMSGRELIANERVTLLRAFAHQELPFERLVQELRPDRAAGPPLFQVTFSYEDIAGVPLDLPGVSAEPFPFGGAASPFDLAVKLIRDEAGLYAQCGYDDGILDAGSVRTLVERYVEVLEAILTAPDAPLGSLPRWAADVPAPDAPADPPTLPGLVWEAVEESAGPRTPTERLVAGLWTELIGAAGTGGQSFFDLGGHSLLVARLAFRVEEETGASIPVADLFQRRTVSDQAALIDELAGAAPATPAGGPVLALRRHPATDAPPVVALPGVLGFGTAFAQVAAHLRAHTMYAVQTRDLVDAHGTGLTFERLVDGCAAAIARVAGGGPVHLTGHSLGGLLAVHLVGALRDRDVAVRGLALLDSTPPDPAAPWSGSRRDNLRAFLGHFAHLMSAEDRAAVESAAADPASTEDAVLAQAQRAVGQLGAVLVGSPLAEQFERYLAISAVAWRVPEPVDQPVLLVSAGLEPTSGVTTWDPYLRGPVTHETVAATHEEMLRPPFAEPLAGRLERFFTALRG
jgi:thioesterase domain-containing protein